MKWIKHFFGFHDWQYIYLENPTPYSRVCNVCHKIEYSVDFIDILNNRIIK